MNVWGRQKCRIFNLAVTEFFVVTASHIKVSVITTLISMIAGTVKFDISTVLEFIVILGPRLSIPEIWKANAYDAKNMHAYDAKNLSMMLTTRGNVVTETISRGVLHKAVELLDKRGDEQSF